MSIEIDRVRTALLIARYQSGDDSAFEYLYAQRSRLVRSTVLQWTGAAPGVIEDLCQQVWLSVFKSLPRMREPMAFDAWINRIIRAEVALFIRRRKRPPIPMDSVVELADPRADLPEEPPHWDQLHAAVDGLAHLESQVLRMRYWSCMSYNEIAESLGIPVGSVRSKLHYAKAKLSCRLSQGEALHESRDTNHRQ